MLGSGAYRDVLQLTDYWLGFFNEAKRLREQIALIFMPELFSGDRKGRARHSARQKIDSPKL